jgi:hypothetical protein
MTTTLDSTPAMALGQPVARRLRQVLGANAATSLLAGAAGLVAAGWWSEELGIPSSAWIRVVSAGLVVFALEVAVVAARRGSRLVAGAAVISALDLAWVAGTVAVLTLVDLTTTGRVVAIAQGIGVLGFAGLQLWLRSRLAAEPATGR